MNGSVSAAQVSQKLRGHPLYSNIYNPPIKHIVLPGLLLGNMAYKLGTEKNPQTRNEVLWNSIVSWVGGALLVNLNNGVLPYFALPAVAGSIALYKIAQKDSPEEKADTAINHASWWASGVITQKIAQLFKLNSPFHTLCAFAVGASIVGPLLSAIVKEKILPLVGKNNKQYIGQTFNQINSGYTTGKTTDINFSPFATFSSTSANQKPNAPPAYDPRDPFHLKKLIPGGFFK